VLDRFEAMSNHRMNISKTMMLLLGRERGFDLRADSPAARALRRRGDPPVHAVRSRHS
jgi:hypothetical protein